MCHDFGESSLPEQYRPMRDFVQSQTLLEVGPAKIEEVYTAPRAVAAEPGMDLRLPRTRKRLHPAGTPGPDRCDWPWHGPYISYQGLAMPCCMIATPNRLHFGSMAARGVEPIWKGPEYQDFRRELASDTPPEICWSCSIYSGTF